MPRLLRAALLGALALAFLPSAAFAAHDVTIGSTTSGFDVSDNGTTRTYTANADDASLSATTLAGDLAAHDVVVNTGSGGAQNGTITVASAVTSGATATGALTLNANWNLTVNAAVDIAGSLDLNSPLATTINAATTALAVSTDNNGEYFVNADVTAAGEISFAGQASLGATVTSQTSDVQFGAGVILSADSTVNAGDDVDMSTTLDGAYSLTVVTGGDLVLGYTGSFAFPTGIDVTGNTTLTGTNMTVTGTLAFHGNVTRVGSEQFDVDQFTLGGTLTGGDITINDATLATFEDGSALGTDVAPLDSLSVSGPASLADTSVVTTNSQTWNAAVAVPGSASLKSAAAMSFLGTIDGAGSLTIDPGTSTPLLQGSVGSTTALSSLSVLGSQSIDFQAATLKADAASFYGINVSSAPATVNLESAAFTIGDGGIEKGFFKTLTITGGGSITGPIGGTAGTLTKAGAGTLVLGGTSTWEGTTTASAGELRVNGVLPGDLSVNGALLSGTGSVGGLVQVTGGDVSPGASPGILAFPDDLVLDNASTFTVELNGTTAGTGYDQATVDGQLTLGGAALNVTPAASLALGQPLTIIDKTSGLDVDGTFAGKAEGSVFDVGSVRLRISYTADDGNNVTLTRVKQPSSLTLTSGPTDAIEGSEVTLTATVSGPGKSKPAGTVSFKEGTTVLGSVPVSNGVATLTTTALSAGDHSLSASYSGDFYDPSSATASQHVAAKPTVTEPPAPTPNGDNPAPTPQPAAAPAISVKDAKARKGFVTFVVSLSKASPRAVTVNFKTKNGTARSGRQYKALKGKLTFRPGLTTLRVKVKLLPRKGKAAKRRFSLVLSGAQGATLGRSVAIGTILK